jgi:uncharacterized membrane protein YfcA
VEVSPLVPLLAGVAISLPSSMAGVSGAFLLLPFQVSVLGFTSPSVSATCLVFNLVAIPAGVYRYVREGRMLWPLAGVILAGTAPGVCIGAILRIQYLPDPVAFKFFVGCVLLCITVKLLRDLAGQVRRPPAGIDGAAAGSGEASRPATFVVESVSWSWRRVTYGFNGQLYSFKVLSVLPLALVVGVVSGIYGIGGGAIVGPLLVTLFRLPIHTVAAAVLSCTFLTSVVGVIFYQLAGLVRSGSGPAVAPDWALGVLFGVGGAIGMYLGARCQRYVPAWIIRILLAAVLLVLSVRYIGGIFG